MEMVNRYCPLWFFVFAAFLPAASIAQQKSTANRPKPNVIVILADDMGIGDISYFHGRYQTPAIDQLATEGRAFTRYYSASPICSPSRVGIMTGMAPAKWSITTFLQRRKENRLSEQADFLSPTAPSVARAFQKAGYATAHFGKWHMGGGRDVNNAPPITAYGFDTYNSTWESPDPDPLLTATNWIWSDKDSIKRWNRTRYFVDKTLAFLAQNRGTPCYINLWPDDVHTPWVGGDDATGKYPGGPEEEKSFIAVLNEFDLQMGRLMDGLRQLGADHNTIIIFTSDNGPLPNFRGDRSAGFRGTKLSLYEGGIRMPFIIKWPLHIPAGTIDSTSVVGATDLFPSLCRMAGVPLPTGYTSDGEDKSTVFLGRPAQRTKALFWEYGRNDQTFRYPAANDRSPSLAMLEGRWKLLMNKDGGEVELYDMLEDKKEKTNLAAEEKSLVAAMQRKLMAWWSALPLLR